MLQENLTDQEFGYWFEGQTLTLLRGTKRSYQHPLIDTRAAGNIVNPQPSDMLVLYEGTSIYIECKTSTKHDRFEKAYKGGIRREQAAACRMITRSKGRYIYLFLSRMAEKVYAYEGDPVSLAFQRKRDTIPPPFLEAKWKDRELFINKLLDYFE